MVYFIGAGPGGPELLTIKGKKIIDRADVIIYAGSLVNPQVMADRKPEAVLYDSAGMHLDQVIAVMEQAEKEGLPTARVHTGDPAIYGAHREQMDRLEALGIPYELVPGVTATAACAALLGCELTLPGVSQTVILTRYANRTAMPAGEALAEVLVTRYPPGAGIGWHRDRPSYEHIVGISFLAPCSLRLRRQAGKATAPFAAALGSAKTKVAEAFTLRQQLDDADPQTAPDRRAAVSLSRKPPWLRSARTSCANGQSGGASPTSEQ